MKDFAGLYKVCMGMRVSMGMGLTIWRTVCVCCGVAIHFCASCGTTTTDNWTCGCRIMSMLRLMKRLLSLL